MQIENVNVKKIISYVNNPRKNDGAAVDKVAASIKEFGFKVPIIIDGNNVVVAGHTRLKAAKQIGMTEVPIIRADDLTKSQVKAFRIADNRIAEESNWDFEKLEIELEGLDDFDIGILGFDDGELSFLDEGEVVEDDYEIQVPEIPKSKVGDVWVMGNQRVMCGDSTNSENIKKLMGNVQADMFLTDPPYNVDYEGGTKLKLKIENDNMEDSAFRSFLADAFNGALEVMKKGAVFYIWHAESEGFNFRAACKDVGLQVRQCLIWNKNSMVMGRQDYHWKHEPCLYGWKDGAGHLWAADRKQTTILNFDRPRLSLEHPNMKPVLLFDYLIKNNTKPGDVILDLFGGSGTTGIACEQNERIAYMMELDPKYVDVIVARWEALTGQVAGLEVNNETL